jgi:hypothetical protein
VSTFLVYVENDSEDVAVVILAADDAEDAARRVRYLLDPTNARVLRVIPSRLSPAMAERLA